MLQKTPEIQNSFGVGGFSFAGASAEPGRDVRDAEGFRPSGRGDAHSAKAVVGRLFGAFSQITGAMVIPFLPPPINGLGTFGGFQYQLLDQTGGPIEEPGGCGAAADRAGQRDAGADGALHAVHGERSAADRDDRSREGQEPRHAAQRHHRHDADPARLGVRERLRLQQPVVSRLRAGGPAFRANPGTSSSTTCGRAAAR